MKKVFFGLAFLGSVLMFNQGANAQDEGLEPGPCYQRMYWCGDKVEALNCETYQTGTRCSRYYQQCYSC
jgi:hypothetical protein